VARGGAQELYGIKPDLTCLGKIVGGGMPLAAYGGRRDVMSCIAPLGPVYQAGTLSGNPLSVAAGLVTLQEIESDPSLYQRLEEAGQHVERELLKLCAAAGVPVRLQRVGSMFTLFFTATPVVDYATAKTSDTQRYAHWFRQLLGEGIYLAPSQFEAAFMGAAHTNADLDTFLAAAGKVLAGGF
jgi:glutamate-1-semialdehyde 2,1-aminomutase